MTETEYQIHQLADKAGVSVRTIRFYINEGLLPPPQAQGRYSVYSEDYLERLELIRLLKDKFLPLKEIRARLEGLSQAEVRAALALEREQEAQADRLFESKTAAESPGGTKALDYINRLLNQPGAKSSRPSQSLPSPAPAQPGAKSSRPSQSLPSPAPAQPSPKRASESRASYATPNEVWERVQLAPGIELHLQQPIPADQRSKLEELVRFARQLFNR